MYCDLMINFVFTTDARRHVVEIQMMHENLYTIRSTGSHRFYGKTRTAREILERMDRIDMIPEIKIELPHLKRSNTRTAWPDSDGHADLRREIDEQSARILMLENMMADVHKRMDHLSRQLAQKESEIQALHNDRTVRSKGCCTVQ